MDLAASYDPQPIKKPNPDGASSKELEDWVSQVIGAISILTALWLASGLSPEQTESVVLRLSMSPEEAKEIAEPAARLLARSGLNKSYGKALVSSSDALALAVGVIAYGLRIGPLIAAKVRSGNVRNPQPPQGLPNADSNGHAQPVAGVPGWAFSVEG